MQGTSLSIFFFNHLFISISCGDDHVALLFVLSSSWSKLATAFNTHCQTLKGNWMVEDGRGVDGGGGGGGREKVCDIYIMERGFTLHWLVCWKKETVKVSSPYKADVTPGFHDVSLRKLFKHAVQGVKSLAFQTEHTESVSCVLPKSSFHLFQCHEGLLICMRCCVFLLRFVKGKGKKFSLTCFYMRNTSSLSYQSDFWSCKHINECIKIPYLIVRQSIVNLYQTMLRY